MKPILVELTPDEAHNTIVLLDIALRHPTEGGVKLMNVVKLLLDKINAAYDESAEAVKGLETALRLNGASVETESARLQEFASSLQSAIGAGDDATLAMMKQASMMGVATEDLDDMAKAAIGLGEAMGTSAESGMEMMRRAQEGNFMAFQKQFPAMKQMQSDEEKLAFVTELAAKGLDAKADASNRVAGMGERANNAIGDLMESVGALLAPVRILISAGITTLAESLSTLLVPAVAYAEEVLANIGPVMDWIKDKVIQGVNLMVGAFTFFEVILTNLDSVWAIVVAQAELWMLQYVGAVKHRFTVEIPAYLQWFGDNFVNLLRDAFNLAYTVIQNGITKIVDAFAALWAYVASWGESDIMAQLGEISGRSYLEGFESSLTDLPEIMGRTITDREKELAATVGQIGMNLGNEFSRKMEERMIGASEGVSADFDKEINLKLNKPTGDKAEKTINATESRLLTRGPGSSIPDKLDKIVHTLERIEKKKGPRMVPAL